MEGMEIFLVARDIEEKNKFKSLSNYKCIFDKSRKKELKEKTANNTTRTFILIHFGEVSSEDELCKKISEFGKGIDKKRVTILPISYGASSAMANKLYALVMKDEIPKNFNDYKDYWEEVCLKYSKKKAVFDLLPFFLQCEIAFKFGYNDRRRKRIDKELERIKGLIGDEESGWLKVFDDREDNWKTLLELQGLPANGEETKKPEIDEEKLKNFIGLEVDDGKKISIEKTEWFVFWGDLKKWANEEEKKEE